MIYKKIFEKIVIDYNHEKNGKSYFINFVDLYQLYIYILIYWKFYQNHRYRNNDKIFNLLLKSWRNIIFNYL